MYDGVDFLNTNFPSLGKHLGSNRRGTPTRPQTLYLFQPKTASRTLSSFVHPSLRPCSPLELPGRIVSKRECYEE
ncbi:BQ5605_C003g02476 [Microbotryum silenes-dioicae]|uniref:BQ5605_C003g02476 protein n=1 Tax=Microbotryum silenes-dioicae TaxID=796604 RepID=A0A2X0NYY0_9BASI|nr:BQ5605_C003g02476 [Microbotryum silenes-dioicae]